MQRSSWKSQLGFTFAAIGSAVGLANVWRFPYIAGKYGGGAFILVYLLCLACIGYPVFLAEITMGRKTKRNPYGAFAQLGKSLAWRGIGKGVVLTGFLVTAFYSVVAGWVVAYFVMALRGELTQFQTAEQSAAAFTQLQQSAGWCVGFHALFLGLCSFVLYRGVRGGIEKGTKILMPLFGILLLILLVRGVTLPGAQEGLAFLFTPDWAQLTPAAVLAALGHSFFTLSLGQGTMITYGSYLSRKTDIHRSCFPVAAADTLVSLCLAVVVMTIAFSAQIEPGSGPGLLFHTLPLVFAKLPGGAAMAALFFGLVVLAALTSEISAMEPVVAYLVDEKGWKRSKAVVAVGGGAFLLGVPCALGFSLLQDVRWGGMSILDCYDTLAQHYMIPLGGFFAVLLVGWRWGIPQALRHFLKGKGEKPSEKIVLVRYFSFSIKYLAPILVLVVFIHTLWRG